MRTKNPGITDLDNWKEEDTHIHNLFCWNYSGNIHSSLLDENVSFVLVAQDTEQQNDINQFDFHRIAQITDS